MLKITYCGKVPDGYHDTGMQLQSFYIDTDKQLSKADCIKWAKHDARQCNDFIYIKFIEVKSNCEPPKGDWAFLTTVYK